MKKFLLTTALLFLVINLISQQKTFLNPVIKGDMSDPSMIRIGDTYYATGSSSEWAPFYPVFTSKDLINWKQVGHVFNEQPDWTSSSFWAPELFYHNNQVYCYYTARRKSDGVSYIGVAAAKSPADKFIDHGTIIEYGTEAIDAFIYDDNGQLYISWKAYGLDQRPIELLGSKLSADGLRLEGKPFTLLVDDENIGMEGQYHFKKGDYYYIIYAAHGCCGPGSDYDVYAARSKKFEGPYEKFEGNPILYGDGIDYTAVGHGTAIETPDGRMFYLCHAYLSGDGFYSGRQPILQEMYVEDDNWVYFKTGNIALREQTMPFANTIQQPVPNFEDTFDSAMLKPDWTWNYPYSNPQINVGNGKMLVSGSPKNDNTSGTVLCVRPKSAHYVYETLVANQNTSFKGLTMYGDDKNNVSIGIDNKKLILKQFEDGIENSVELSDINSPVYLKIEVDHGCNLIFSWSKNGNDWTQVNDIPQNYGRLVRWDRVARPGLVHIGNPDQPAEFSYFKLINSD